jgi:ABC1 atypical kinase-like domain
MDKKTINAIKRHRTARLARLGARSYMLHKKGKTDDIATLICDEFVSLGGVYLKFLQGVLLRSKMMRNWKSPNKLRIFENIDTEPLDVVAILRRELGAHKLAQITSIQPQPFAAGTFGQVYYGQLADGRPIIVKVLRPMIKDTLKYDLKLLNTFMNRFYLKFTTKNMDADARGALKDFSAATLNETNYKAEMEFAHELYENYKENNELYIPETFTDLCTGNIIVQEYVAGISVAELLKLKEQGVNVTDYVRDNIGSDLEKQMETLGFELLRGAFDFKRIQGDPHPGNIKLLPNNQVGLIDFGISAKSPEDKASFYALLEAYNGLFSGTQTISNLFEKTLRFFVKDLYRALFTISKFMGKDAEAALTSQLGAVAESTFEKVTGSKVVELSEGREDLALIEANKVFNQGNRFGLVMKLDDTAMMRSAQSFMTLLFSLGLYSKILPRVTGRVTKYVSTKYPEITEDVSVTSLSDAIDTVSSWLERVADKDPQLFRELSNKLRLKAATLETGETNA